MKNLKIVFFGTPDYIMPIVQALRDNFNLAAVVTAGQEITEKLLGLQPDLLVVASYGKIITQSVLNVAQYGAINVHPSLLPQYRGPSPIQSAILNGDNKSGITHILMDEKMDHGPILYQEDFALSHQDTFDSLSKKMFLRSAYTLPQIINGFLDGKLKPTEQDHSKATFCKIINKNDGYFDISHPPSSEILDKMVRAYYPWPTAWTRWNGKIVKFYPDKKIQIEGRSVVSNKDFLNGYPDFPLMQLLGL